MEELNTLKDLLEKDELNADGFITAQILRQEAIKWIKKMNEAFERGNDFTTPISHYSIIRAYKNEKEQWALRMMIQSFMDFFNLTEEDLK